MTPTGGGQIEAQTVEKGKTVTKPEDPTKEGVGFGGWLLDGKLYDFSKPVTSNITLKAAWGIASSGNNFYQSLEEAIQATQTGTIKLLTDINATSQIVISNSDLILDMNKKTISNTTDIWNESNDSWSFISVQENAKLTITGNGIFDAKENDCYAIDIRDGGKLLIENGIYKGNCHAIYVYEGSLFVNGGEFSVKQKYSVDKPDEFVLNCYDPNYKRKDLESEPNIREYTGPANIEVSGGIFHGFNPGNCQAEGSETDFLKAGYKSVEAETGIYTVVPLTQEGSLTDYIDILNIIGCATNKVMTTESYASDPSLTIGTIDTIDNNTELFIFFNETEVVLQPTELLNWDVDTNSQVTVILDGKISKRHTIDTDNTFGVIDFRRNTSIDRVLHKIYASGNNTADYCIIDDVIINDIEEYNPPIINQ